MSPPSGPNAPSEPEAPPVVSPTAVELIYGRSATRGGEAGAEATRDWGKVTLPRQAIFFQGLLLAAVALVSFVFGLMVGANTRPVAGPAGWVGPAVLSGRVTRRSAGDVVSADAGSVVLVLPKEERPDAKIPAASLGPLAPSPDDGALAAIRDLGGAYVRTDSEGRFRLRVPRGGPFFVLVLSRHQSRDVSVPLNRRHLAQLGRYLLPADELLGQSAYLWDEVTLAGEQTREIEF